MFPAGAGMNREALLEADREINVPRRRGDEPFKQLINGLIAICSPQARG